MKHIEYEATFPNIKKEDIRKRLIENNAIIIHNEQLLKRVAFNLPEKNADAFVRVRDEFGKTTMTYKNISGNGIEGQKEIEISIDNFDNGVLILEYIGCKKKSYQETLRETWQMQSGAMVTIDTWPFLESFIEIEGKDEEVVKNTSSLLGFEWDSAIFDSVTIQYSRKYGISKDRINNQTPMIIFDMNNPFL